MLLLFFSLLSAFHSTGSHPPITVDGDPSDWIGSTPQYENSEAYDQGEYIWRDAVNDDSGDGDYLYPLNAVFDTFPEDDQVYDLLEWRVTSDMNNVYFLFRIANITNPWSGTYGFSHQLPIILIDQDRVPGSGRTDVIRDANCKVSEDAAWEWAIWSSGWLFGAEDAAGNEYDLSSFLGAAVAGSTLTDHIEIGVPMSLIGDPKGQTWRFVVILGPEEFSRCRKVDANVSDWRIGGGEGNSSVLGNDPNFLDLAFYNSISQQEAELGEYLTTGSMVVLDVYKDVTFGGQAFGGSLDVTGIDTLMNGSSDRTATFNVTSFLNFTETQSYTVYLTVSSVSPGSGFLEDFNFTFTENGFTLNPGQSRTVILYLQYVGTSSYTSLSSGEHFVRVIANFTAGGVSISRGESSAFTAAASVPPVEGPTRQIDVIFLFHFNQNLVPYGDQANDASYVGLLKTLRKHPNSKFAIHVSGSLMEDLQWFNNTAIQLIRDGVQEGQFEVIGSTYIQNVMYSTRMNDTDYQFNDEQIKEHREIIEKIFGVSPKGFWNPERTWTQSFVPLLVDNGYEYTQVEDHILYDSGITGSEYLVRTTTYNGKQLVVFTDDKTFEGYVNGAVDSGSSVDMINFLRNQYSYDVEDQFAICYFEDAEATGLWDYEGGEDPHIDWNNLDNILTDLENESWIKITTYEEFLESHSPAEDVSPIVDGAASWMGGDAWFDQNNSPMVQSYRVFFNSIRNRLNQVNASIQDAKNGGKNTTSAEKLLEHAWTTLLAHQYEFGCVIHSGYTDFDLARTALVSAEAALYSLNPSPTSQIVEVDINNDSITEIVVKNQHNMYVWSGRGGRLLYWFDIDNGEELVGNENFMYYLEAYTDDNTYVPTLKKGDPLWPWLSGNNLIPWDIYKRFIIRRRALNDFLKVDGSYIGSSNFTLVNANYAYSITGNSILFSYSDGEITLEKNVTMPADGRNVDVSYSITYEGAGSADVELEIEIDLCPSYEMVMEGGRDILQYWKDGQIIPEAELPTQGTLGVLNVESGELVALILANSTTSMKGDGNKDVFGKMLIPKFEIDQLGSGDTVRFGFTLAWSRIPPDPEFFKDVRHEGERVVVEIPTYVRKTFLRYESNGSLVEEVMEYYGPYQVSAQLPEGWYEIVGEDIYGNVKIYAPIAGMASFSMLSGMLSIYEINLECDLDISFGNRLLVVFFSWEGGYQGNVTI
ncbi:MAG: glucodextranase DOMON-like domain-containing protein, partial [Candidatus Bathyarchaeia archaeon]